MLSAENRRLVEAATETLRQAHRSEDHTVAAAARDSAGNVFTGMNVYHFTGGPCAEPVAIGQAVASARARLPLTAMVAVNERGVISPCGRCRQILFDACRDIDVLVRSADGLVAVPVAELLPYAFDRHAEEPGMPQTLHVWEGYLDAVRRRTKTSTIRVDDPVRPGAARLVFDHDASGTSTELHAEITDVVATTPAGLTEEDAVRDGFGDLAELRRALGRHYPGIQDAAEIDIVHFRLDAPHDGES